MTPPAFVSPAWPALDPSLPLLPNVVAGARTPSSSSRRSPVLDPARGLAWAQAPVSTPQDLDEAFRGAREGFQRWRRSTPAQRQAAMLDLADLVEAHADEIVATECRNTGKPEAWVRNDELPPILDTLRFFAGAARALQGPLPGEFVPGHFSSLRREPLGVVAAVTPWNYPLWMAIWKIAPALAAGDAIVLKPAETTPATPLLLAELAAQVLPPGVLTVVCGDRDTGRLLVEHPEADMVSITGSVRAGREVAAAAGRHLKRVHLELGGNAPVLVLDDADLDLAVPGIVAAGYYNAGQSCTAASRVLVTAGVYDEFVARLAEAAQQTRVAVPQPDGSVSEGYYGALNNPDQLARVAGLVERRSDRAEVVAGGAPLGPPGYFYEPTVVAGVGHEDELARTEIFGPVVTVTRVADVEEAVRLANDSDYALSASVWTRDSRIGARLQTELDAGSVWLNCHSVLSPEMPHGGFKASGHGSDLSLVSLEEYTRVKHAVTRM
ncbi:MAG: aldehyde dehydrogenase family protein [Actinomycetales bacterium]